jgi:TfoX/Sxy family transcriptional regulator of competence genes
MTQAQLTPRERYAQLVETFLGNPDVIPPAESHSSKKTFGSSTLRFKGKIFAMLVDEALVVKLPRKRVDALIELGAGQRFDGGKGQLLKEWLRVEPSAEERWLPLTQEALEFVGDKG